MRSARTQVLPAQRLAARRHGRNDPRMDDGEWLRHHSDIQTERARGSMTNQFETDPGRIAIVTGSAQGMGRAMALALAAAGADIVLLDRNAAGIEATAHTIRELGRKALPIAGDVTDTDHIDGVFTVDRGSGGWTSGTWRGEARAGAAEAALADIRTTFHNPAMSAITPVSLRDGGCWRRAGGASSASGSIAVLLLGAGAIAVGHGDGGGDPDDARDLQWAGRGVRVTILRRRCWARMGWGLAWRPILGCAILSCATSGGAVWAGRRYQGPGGAAGIRCGRLSSPARPFRWMGAILVMNGGGGLLAPIMERRG